MGERRRFSASSLMLSGVACRSRKPLMLPACMISKPMSFASAMSEARTPCWSPASELRLTPACCARC